LERLLLEMNDPLTSLADQRRALELALPYCHAPKAADTPATFNINALKTADEMVEAQRKIFKSMSAGKTPIALGKMMIESLAVMIKSLDISALEDTLDQMRNVVATNRTRSARPFTIIDGGQVDDLARGEEADG
jgi:hypothetical protein